MVTGAHSSAKRNPEPETPVTVHCAIIFVSRILNNKNDNKTILSNTEASAVFILVKNDETMSGQLRLPIIIKVHGVISGTENSLFNRVEVYSIGILHLG